MEVMEVIEEIEVLYEEIVLFDPISLDNIGDYVIELRGKIELIGQKKLTKR